MGTVKKEYEHGNTLPDTAVSSKKGDFNTPSVNPFFKRKTAALIIDFQNRRSNSTVYLKSLSYSNGLSALRYRQQKTAFGTELFF